MKIFNYIVIIILVISAVWFVLANLSYFQIQTPPTYHPPIHIDLEPFVAALSGIILFLLKYFLIERKKLFEPKKYSLSDHLIFDTIEDLIENNLKFLNFGNEGRTEALRLMIKIQLRTFSEVLKEFINKNIEYEDGNDFRKKLRACIFEIISQTEKRWREANIPELLIEKYNSLYKQRINLLLSDILTASMVVTVKNNKALENFLNDARIILLTSLQEDAVMALKALNGELKNLTFNGKNL